MAEPRALEAARRLLARELRPRGIDLEFMSLRGAFLQSLLSRGDRRCADLLEIAHRREGGDLRRALRRWPHDAAFFALREAGEGEVLPWDFLDQGLEKRFLLREWRRGVGAKLTPKCQVETCRACATPTVQVFHSLVPASKVKPGKLIQDVVSVDTAAEKRAPYGFVRYQPP